MFKRLLLLSFLLALGYFPLALGAKAGDNPTLDTGTVVVSTSAAIRTITNYLNKKEYNPNQKIDVHYSYQQIPMDWEVQTALLTISQNRLSLARNEIFARHGQPFKSIWGKIYENVSWYRRAATVDESQFTPVERENITNITKFEKALLEPAIDRSRTETYDPEVQSLAEGLVKRDETAKSLSALKKLAAAGNTEAQCLLGYAYDRAEYTAKAFPWLKLAANDSHPGAQSLLSSIYWDGGPGVPKDRLKSDEWNYKAAIQGKASDQKSLANRLPEGAEKVVWLMRAAKQGSQGALFQLSDRSLHGKGVPKDNVAAYMYLTLVYRQIDDTEDKLGALAALLTPEEKLEAERRAEEFASNGLFRTWGFFPHTCTDAVPDPEPVMSMYVKTAIQAEGKQN